MAATVWRGRLAFGLVSIPVRLFKAARRQRVRFHNVYRPAALRAPSFVPAEEPEPEPEPEIEQPPARSIRQIPVPSSPRLPEPQPAEAEPEIARVRHAPVADFGEVQVPQQEILKGYELERDRYVVLNPAEIAALRPRTSSEVAIAEFVRLNEIDPIFFETSYYVVPEPGGEKPYALLFRTMAEANYAALGSLAMHGREYAVVIRHGRRGLILHTMFFDEETARDQEYAADPALVAGKELQMAKMLVEALAAPFDSTKLKDAQEARLRALIDARSGTALDAGPPKVSPGAAPAVDILDALRKSLEAARKPVKSETRPAEKQPKKRGRR